MSRSLEQIQRPVDQEDVPVTWPDQQRINTFGRQHTRLLDLEDDIVAKKQECDNIKDAITDIENVFDEDSCRIQVGEVYFEVSNEDAMEYTKRIMNERQTEYNKLLQERVCV